MVGFSWTLRSPTPSATTPPVSLERVRLLHLPPPPFAASKDSALGPPPFYGSLQPRRHNPFLCRALDPFPRALGPAPFPRSCVANYLTLAYQTPAALTILPLPPPVNASSFFPALSARNHLPPKTVLVFALLQAERPEHFIFRL